LEGVKTLQLTQEIPLDIQSKLCVALIHLKKADLITPLVDTLLEADVEQYGDIYLDVAEAYMESQNFHKAVILLDKLVNSDK
jgi:general transcription factor 3C polypeptide 3 (transcription factor C subunit 4)